MSGACGPEQPEEQSACCAAEDTTWPTRIAGQQCAIPPLEQPPDGTRSKKTMAEVEQELEDMAKRTLDTSDNPVSELEANDMLECLVTLSGVDEEVISDAWEQILAKVRQQHADARRATETAGSSRDHIEDAVIANLTAIHSEVLAFLHSHSDPPLAALIATAMEQTPAGITPAAANAEAMQQTSAEITPSEEEEEDEEDEEEERWGG